MTKAEKIIVDLIDQRKINGAEALELIKSLEKETKFPQIDIPKLWGDSNQNCAKDTTVITAY